ncbi:hypothetical protein JCM19992_03750 [Thermostilla marina]
MNVKKQRRIRLLRALSRAEGYLELNMPRAAIDALQKCADEEEPRLYYLLGEAYRSLEQYDTALSYFEKANTLDRGHIGVLMAMGWCHKRLGRLDLAIDDLREAAMLEPSHPIVLFNLACYLSLQGQAEEAAEYLAQAILNDEELRELVDREPDFDPIRDTPEFRRVMEDFDT